MLMQKMLMPMALQVEMSKIFTPMAWALSKFTRSAPAAWQGKSETELCTDSLTATNTSDVYRDLKSELFYFGALHQKSTAKRSQLI